MHQSTLPISIPLPASRDRPTRRNGITPGHRPLIPGLAPPSEALTFAQARDPAGQPVTLLVTGYGDDAIEGVDVEGLGAAPGSDPFEAVGQLGRAALVKAAEQPKRAERRRLSEILPSGARFERHVATGTNFAEHAREAGIGSVFNFPKFGEPTPADTSLGVRPGTLMDYEVEISVRFDRDIRAPADFDAALKGFFLCGDFTDRAELVRLVDRRNIASGRGFSDAKSGPDWFPTGPFLVIPDDWRTFVAGQRIATRVNGELRQDASGSSMILDFRALVAKALTGGGGGDYVYKGRRVPLLEGGVIPRGSAVMSGTSEGVIFMPPLREDFIGGIIDHVVLGRFLTGRTPDESVANRFVRNELKAGRYLRAGDTVEHLSSSLGALLVKLVAE